MRAYKVELDVTGDKTRNFHYYTSADYAPMQTTMETIIKGWHIQDPPWQCIIEDKWVARYNALVSFYGTEVRTV